MASPCEGRVLMPWEYRVCKACFNKNVYAVWLVWYGCFERAKHCNIEEVVVAIDTDNIKLVRVRRLPPQQHGSAKLCKTPLTCTSGDRCIRAHSQVELDCWTANLKINKPALVEKVRSLRPVRSSRVCQQCLSASSRAHWLTWLTCTDSSHAGDTVTALLDGERLVTVCEWIPENQQQLALCQKQNSCNKKMCKSAHSQIELDYWKWLKISRDVYDQLGGSMAEKFAYPFERSSTVRAGVECTNLSCDNYKSKYHKLVYLDNLEHARKMVADCDGHLTIDSNPQHGTLKAREVHVVGMSSTSMNIAYQKPVPCRAHITLHYNERDYRVSGEVVDKTEMTLVVLLKRDLPSKMRMPTAAYIHFEYSHWYFHRLHCAIDYADRQLIQRLVNISTTQADYYPAVVPSTFNFLQIDSEYQPNVLTRILRGGCGSPFLLLGPFGTGKTHLLMASIVILAKNGGRILVCTHHNRGADSISEKLTLESILVHRLSPNDDVATIINELSVCPVIVTTFTTALRLKEKDRQGFLQFTHIIIDEGAQSREPEALGALLMARDSTHIVIAGDNKQVGPKVSVLSEVANENGLGESIIERLLKLYDQHMSKEDINSSRYSLLTNYRCHPSILMLASSLFYDCSLQPRGSTETHPLAPYPVVFQCSSLEEESSISSAVNETEVKLLLQKAFEFIKAWPKTEGGPPSIALLAGSEAQVRRIRLGLAMLKQGPLRCSVQSSLTYSIQGSEFDAVFLSTHEPTDRDDKPLNTVRSICNQYVFNTVITRSRSLIFAVGNPFRLIQTGSHFSVNCWSELIQRCITCQSFHLPQDHSSSVEDLPIVVKQLSEIVFSTQNSEMTVNDSSNEGYRKLFMSQEDERYASCLTKNPTEIIGTRYWNDSDESDDDNDEDVAVGQLELLTYRKGRIISDDPDVSGTVISCAEERRCIFSGQQVKFNKRTKQIVVDQEAVKRVNKKYFGFSFLCRVNVDNMVQFYPFNKTIPIFHNIPKLTRRFLNEGVVCFHPNSINDCPKACNFIPKECAVTMVFIVTFLRWRKKFPHPLGIVTGVLPCGTSVFTGDLLLKIAHNIPRADDCTYNDSEDTANASQLPRASQQFNSVITIDPEGSKDHDDALSCTKKGPKGGGYVYEFGVHITDVQKFVSQNSELDKFARERGCSAYSSTAQCVSHMLPKKVVQEASILPNKPRDAFSVVAKVTVKDNKHDDTMTVSKVDSVRVLKSRITSVCELTYKQAYDSLFQGDDQVSKKLKVLWAVACFLREKRLKNAALHLSVDGEDEIMHPEAHILVEELMIWANQVVAKKLFEHDQLPVIFRCQPVPNKDDLEILVTTQSQNLSVSLDLRQYVSRDVRDCPPVQVLPETIQAMETALKEGAVRKALHYVQFEHLHPQVAVGHALFNMIRQRASYCVAREGNPSDSYSHSSLQCTHYTHFTSPIRRFIDLVIQRMLLAVLNQDISPYEDTELEEISAEMGEKYREADKYEDDRKSLDLALQFQQSSREYSYFVKEVKAGELTLAFHDVTLKAASRYIRGVHLKHLNAASIPQRESSPGPDDDGTADVFGDCKWLAKFASAQGTLGNFLSSPHLQPATANRQVKMSVLTGEQPITDHTCWDLQTLHASITPFTQSLSMENWRRLQEYVQSPPSNPEVVRSLLPSPPVQRDPQFPSISHTPLWVYEFHRPLQSCEVLRVQLTGCFNSATQRVSPTVQLLEVGPNLRVCIQHNSNPTGCFTDTALSKPPKQGHTSINEYFLFWEQALLAEAATASLTDTELMIITDVTLVWPPLRRVTDSQGQVFYQLPRLPAELKKPKDYCACIHLSKNFAISSYDFISIHQGDLMCVRCYGNHGGNEVRSVFHMVVHSVEKPEESGEVIGVDVYLKFVGERPNYISQQIEATLTTLSYEIQVIQLTLPFRRVYSNLHRLKKSTDGSLSQLVATGDLHDLSPSNTDDCSEQNRSGASNVCLQEAGTCTVLNQGPDGAVAPPTTQLLTALKDKLGSDVAQVASSIWPMEESGQQLNEYQLKAIQLACCNKFVVIQGPPGTGKSVTGAHIAYALAMKLRKEVGKDRKKEGTLNPCVMYCGPSQQSVNVVLDILTSSAEVQASGLKIVRVYSNAIESKDFPGPKSNPLVFREVKVDGRCEEQYRKYALHHMIRERNQSIASLDEEFGKLKTENKIPSARNRAEYREAVTAECIAALRNDVDIVLCTCNEAGSHRITWSVSPTYCIIDECAMATEPECMVAVRRASNVVLIGDDKQLQPVLHNDEAKKMGMSTSLFERYVRAHLKPHMLQIQYRMHASLCEFPSDEFYDGMLQTSPFVGQKYDGRLDRLDGFWPQGRDLPLVFCDVIGEEEENHTGHRGTARVGLESKRNTKEARKIVELAVTLISRHKVEPGEIAVITPYSAQKEEVKKQLKRNGNGVENVIVKTITDAQGSEFGLVLLSTVRSLPPEMLPVTRRGEKNKDLGWKRENLGFITDKHQICVGITRCKYGLAIVGNRRLLAYDQTWARLTEHYQQKKCLVEGADFPSRT